LQRVKNDICEPIPPTEMKAWLELTGTIMHMREYEILRAMDQSYCSECNKELRDYHERMKGDSNK